jgi:hypothetical protein
VNVLVAILTLALLLAVLTVLSGPLRARRGDDVPGGAGGGSAGAHPEAVRASERAAIEAARDSKYREIKDADLDFRTGKLSAADHQAIDNTLRAEALALLDRLQALERSGGAEPAEGIRSGGAEER